MSEWKTVDVGVDPVYTVSIGSGLLRRCGALLRPVIAPCRMAVISDDTVAPLYADTVCDSLRRAGYGVCRWTFPAGEAHKNMTTLAALLDFLAEQHLTRSDCVAALGGGVCGDMAGFAAGCYLRGIRYVQLPTTLLAAVDSSVGGKTAVDLPAGKNLAGLFWQPAAVLCDTDCLALLSDGAAEAVKTGVLSGEPLFSLLETDAPPLPEVIERCVSYKAGVVARDARESGERQLLNLGHTAGHAMETCSGYTVSHGRAVAMGLALMARASEKLGWCQAPCAQRIIAALSPQGLPTAPLFTPRQLAEAALADKKRVGDDITLVIPGCIGGCYLKKCPVAELESVFAAGWED